MITVHSSLHSCCFYIVKCIVLSMRKYTCFLFLGRWCLFLWIFTKSYSSGSAIQWHVYKYRIKIEFRNAEWFGSSGNSERSTVIMNLFFFFIVSFSELIYAYWKRGIVLFLRHLWNMENINLLIWRNAK